MLIPSSSVSKLPGLFQLIDSLPSSLNPYSAILNSLNAAKADLDKTLKSYTHFLLVLLIVHSVLGVIALISLAVDHIMYRMVISLSNACSYSDVVCCGCFLLSRSDFANHLKLHLLVFIQLWLF